VAGAVPHSTPILTDGALKLGGATLDVRVTGIATFVMLLSLSTFSNQVKNRLKSLRILSLQAF